MSDFMGFTVAAHAVGGGLASSALPGAPVVEEPERPPRAGVRHVAATALLGLAFGSARLASRLEPHRSAGSLVL
jgi:hypothetical protein